MSPRSFFSPYPIDDHIIIFLIKQFKYHGIPVITVRKMEISAIQLVEEKKKKKNIIISKRKNCIVD